MPTYTALPNFFVQDSPSADPRQIGAVPPRFGLHPRFASWAQFRDEIDALGRDVKVFWLCRHGQGVHNVAEAKYGTKAWDEYWSLLEGDGEITWGPDPPLTPLGRSQAQTLQSAWTHELTQDPSTPIPFPQRLFASPLTRALETHDFVFGEEIERRGMGTVIVENLREHNGLHTCDKRLSLTYLTTSIPASFPRSNFTPEPGMSEEDTLWSAEYRETEEEVKVRAGRAVGWIWEEVGGGVKYVGITAHSGLINGILQAVGRQPYALPTGGILPVVVKRVDS